MNIYNSQLKKAVGKDDFIPCKLQHYNKVKNLSNNSILLYFLILNEYDYKNNSRITIDKKTKSRFSNADFKKSLSELIKIGVLIKRNEKYEITCFPKN